MTHTSRESIHSSTTPDPDNIWESDKKHKKKTYNAQESQDVNPFPAGDLKAARNNKDKHKK